MQRWVQQYRRAPIVLAYRVRWRQRQRAQWQARRDVRQVQRRRAQSRQARRTEGSSHRGQSLRAQRVRRSCGAQSRCHGAWEQLSDRMQPWMGLAGGGRQVRAQERGQASGQARGQSARAGLRGAVSVVVSPGVDRRRPATFVTTDAPANGRATLR